MKEEKLLSYTGVADLLKVNRNTIAKHYNTFSHYIPEPKQEGTALKFNQTAIDILEYICNLKKLKESDETITEKLKEKFGDIVIPEKPEESAIESNEEEEIIFIPPQVTEEEYDEEVTNMAPPFLEEPLEMSKDEQPQKTTVQEEIPTLETESNDPPTVEEASFKEYWNKAYSEYTKLQEENESLKNENAELREQLKQLEGFEALQIALKQKGFTISKQSIE